MEHTKDVQYNAADGDYAYLLNGEIVGYAPTRLQAQQKLNDVVYDLLARPTCSAAALSPEDAADVLIALDPATTLLVEEAAGDVASEAGVEHAACPRRTTVRVLVTINSYDAVVLDAMLRHGADAFATPELHARAARLADYLTTRIASARQAA